MSDELKAKTPERIWLIPDGEHGFMWCNDPAPGIDMNPEDATEYVLADRITAAEARADAAEARVKAYEDALDPNQTKHAYIGEIKNEDGRTMAWTATKETMAMIRARASRIMKGASKTKCQSCGGTGEVYSKEIGTGIQCSYCLGEGAPDGR